jgi:hypothetical protein
MRLTEIRIVPREDACQLEGEVESDVDPDDAQWFAPFTLWYRFPVWCESHLSTDNGDPFLAALLLLAMQTGERLTIPAPVSPTLRDALPNIQAIVSGFYPTLQPIPVDVTARPRPLPGDEHDGRVGLFFSMGVDSYYSLLKSVAAHPADDRTLSHLISVNGFDVTYEGEDGRFPPALLHNFARVADALEMSLLPVSTNIRRVGVRITTWPALHGAALASVALALGSAFRRVSIAATTTYDMLFPWGSHPLLDPLWSTETLRFVHDGCEINIIDKTAVVARSDLALETLRPCAGHATSYNCGRCEKCLRTMLDLLIAGRLGRCRTLPGEIDPEWLRGALRPGGRTHMAEFQRRLDALEAIGAAPLLCNVLREHLSYGMGNRFRARYGLVPTWGTRRKRLVNRLLRRNRYVSSV